MNSIWNFIVRNAVWIALGLGAALLLSLALPEIKTVLLCILIESLATAMSGAAHFVFTKVDFSVESPGSSNSGLIFLGVHVCIGMTVLGVYLAQFGI